MRSGVGVQTEGLLVNAAVFSIQVVTAWINGCPEAATWTNLVEALTEVGRRKNAQEIAEKRGTLLQVQMYVMCDKTFLELQAITTTNMNIVLYNFSLQGLYCLVFMMMVNYGRL